MLTEEQQIAIKKQGFKVVNPDKLHLVKDDNLNGVILQDGTLITLKGFNEHRFVYPFLKKLGLVNSSDWTDENSAIHISSNQLNGDVAHSLSDSYAPIYKEELVSEAQLKSLFMLRNVLDGSYGEYDTVADLLYQHTCMNENHGGKYNGLAFLKKYYSDAKGFNVRLPKFSKDQPVNVGEGKVCIRTSPDKSLPGLLNSKFDINPYFYQKEVNEIFADYMMYSDLIPKNNLHWFFQQQLDGINGVCNVRGREHAFTYDVSAVQGDIVQGKKGKHRLSKRTEKELETIAVNLAKEMRKSIQMEFVVSKGELYIVQFRLLKNEPEECVSFGEPTKDEVLCFGKTFSRGRLDVDVKDILVIDKEDENVNSSILIGKKALVVTGDVEFSHLLALSKALKIPSMFATGKIDFGKRRKVEFVAYNLKSWII